MIEHQGESAVLIELDENGVPRICAVQKSKPEGFTMEEIRMAYLTTAVPRVENDALAVQLFQEYVGQLAGESEIRDTYVTRVENRAPERSSGRMKDPLAQFTVSRIEPESSEEEYTQHTSGDRCSCCNYADWVVPGFEENVTRDAFLEQIVPGGDDEEDPQLEKLEVFSKKYKPVAKKVKPVLGTSTEEFRIERHIIGDPLADMPQLNPNPPEFKPTGRYTTECK